MIESLCFKSTTDTYSLFLGNRYNLFAIEINIRLFIKGLKKAEHKNKNSYQIPPILLKIT
jgi:hypothetical protein